jgi:type I restriction enzyme S subunit
MGMQPKLRFKGFTDDWEKRRLIDNTKLITKGTTPKDKSGVGNVNFIKVENLSNNQIHPVQKISQEEHDSYLKRSRLQANDILFSIAGTLGRIAIVSPSLLPANTNQALSIIRGYDFDSDFLITSLSGHVVAEYIRKNPTVGAQPNLSLEQVGDLIISSPIEEEQEKIGSFFKLLNHLITVNQRKVDLLKKKKAGYLQKLFPRNGQNKPELRFKGYTDAWEKRKLGDVSSSFEYGLNAASKKFDGKHKYIRITDIDDETHLFSKSNLTSPDINLDKAIEYMLRPNDILFARTGASVGKTYKYIQTDGEVYFAGFLIRATISKDNDVDFIYQHTLTNKYKNFIKVTSQRSGQPGVNAKEFRTFEIMIPKHDEQQKVGDLLKTFDQLITVNQRKVDLLKKEKKSLLQKMFV